MSMMVFLFCFVNTYNIVTCKTSAPMPRNLKISTTQLNKRDDVNTEIHLHGRGRTPTPNRRLILGYRLFGEDQLDLLSTDLLSARMLTWNNNKERPLTLSCQKWNSWLLNLQTIAFIIVDFFPIHVDNNINCFVHLYSEKQVWRRGGSVKQ